MFSFVLLIVCLILHSHFASQSPVESPQVSPVPGSPPAARVEEVEMSPSPPSSPPDRSCSLSVPNSVSSLEQQAAQPNRQVLQSPLTPKRTQAPAGSSAQRLKRRGECFSRQQGDCIPFPVLLEERSNRVSDLAAAASG